MTANELTKNQSIVLAALTDIKTPLTAYEILDRPEVRGGGLKAPLSVYRALEKLVGLGLVHRIESLNAYLACCHSEAHAEPASFVICEACRTAVELPIRECKSHLTKSARGTGFRIDSIHVEMLGRCPDCQ